MLRTFATLLVGAALGCAEPVAIRVDGSTREVNGTSTVPRGLFGVHNLPLTDAIVADWGIECVRTINYAPAEKPLVPTGIVNAKDANGKPSPVGWPANLPVFIECLWDRYQPAVQMTRGDWKAYLAGLGRGYGQNARTTGRRHMVEFWNEAYLNWATRPAVNLLGWYYDQSEAAPGRPMRLKSTKEVVPGLVWDRQVYVALKPVSLVLDQWASGTIPQDGTDGQTVKLRGRPGSITLVDGATVEISGPRILRKIWIGKDTTQQYYWSGEVNRAFYIDMYTAFGSALKQSNPEVQLAAGWGFNLFNEDWACWERLVRPTIDAVHPWMDAIHEHHYGGDSRLVAASYEVAYAYTLSRYGKRLQFWNTEAGGHLDPEQPGVAKSAGEGAPILRATAAMTYMLRDIIHLLAFCPDKAVTRATHQPQDNGGDEIAFRMLKPLRGTLMSASSSDPRVWTVASRDDHHLCVAVFNDQREARDLTLTVQAPPGQRLAGGRRLGSRTDTRTVQKADGQHEEPCLRLAESDLGVAEAASWSGQVAVTGTSGVVLDFTLAGTAQEATRQRWTQHVSPDVLVAIAAKGQAVTAIAIPEKSLAGATGAKLRLALSGIPEGLSCTLNGAVVPLPRDVSWTLDIDIDPHTLRPLNQLAFTSTSDAVVTLASASLWLRNP